MKVQFDLRRRRCVLIREPHDKLPKNESQLLHWLKRELLWRGYDCIKKRMWKDGHLVSEHQQYVRDRRGRWALWSSFFALRDISEDFNHDGRVSLLVEIGSKRTGYFASCEKQLAALAE